MSLWSWNAGISFGQFNWQIIQIVIDGMVDTKPLSLSLSSSRKPRGFSASKCLAIVGDRRSMAIVGDHRWSRAIIARPWVRTLNKCKPSRTGKTLEHLKTQLFDFCKTLKFQSKKFQRSRVKCSESSQGLDPILAWVSMFTANATQSMFITFVNSCTCYIQNHWSGKSATV